MPLLETLEIQVYGEGVNATRGKKRATHEDYTIGILTGSELTPLLDKGFSFGARHIAALISRDVELEDDFFLDGGLDYRRVLSQIISSELDVDRLDYLVRDSYFSGAQYGQVDVNWLLSNLCLHHVDEQVSLAIRRRSLYAFDDFMVARYHMFVMVYFHHKSVVLEEMLKRYFQGNHCDYVVPSDMASYLGIDDIQLHAHLRASSDPWARAIVEGRLWKRVLELHGTPHEVDLEEPARRLSEAGVDYLAASAIGKFSRYTEFGQKREAAPSIFVLGDGPGVVAEPLDKATEIFKRYQDERRISRIYVEPHRAEEARKILSLRS